MADHRLTAKAIYGGAKTLIKIKAGAQAQIIAHLIDLCAKYHTLHDIRGTQAPYSRGEVSIVRIVYLALVIPTSGLPRERQAIFPSAKLDIKEAFRNIDIRCAIFAPWCPA